MKKTLTILSFAIITNTFAGITWTCSSPNIDQASLPNDCKSTKGIESNPVLVSESATQVAESSTPAVESSSTSANNTSSSQSTTAMNTGVLSLSSCVLADPTATNACIDSNRAAFRASMASLLGDGGYIYPARAISWYGEGSVEINIGNSNTGTSANLYVVGTTAISWFNGFYTTGAQITGTNAVVCTPDAGSEALCPAGSYRVIDGKIVKTP